MKKMNQNLVAVQMCTLCGDRYLEVMDYCDNSYECATDCGESLVSI